MKSDLEEGLIYSDRGARGKIVNAFAIGALVSIAVIYDFRLIYLLLAGILAVALVRKPQLILFILVSFALLRLDAWISSKLSIPFGKVLFLFTALSISSVALFTSYRMNRFSKGVLAYLGFLLLYLLFGLIHSSSEGLKLWAYDAIYALSYLVAIYLLINERKKLEYVLKIMIFLGVITSAINIYEFLHPYSFVLSHSTGRAAGLLKNANTSAFIVNISFIASIYAFRTARSAAKALFLMLLQGVMFLGVFVTFSREGLIVFALAFFAQLLTAGRKRAGVILLLVLLLATISSLAVRQIESSSVMDVQRSFTKITSMLSGEIDDNDRLYLLQYHLRRFLLHPITGNGLYSSLLYSVPETGKVGYEVPNGPHNTFALILSEAGIFATLAYLFFLVSAFFGLIRKLNVSDEDSKALKGVLILLFGALLIHHFFSHMIVFSRYAMVLFAVSLLPARVFNE